MRINLFSTWYNTALSLLFASIVVFAVASIGRFVFLVGNWEIVRVNLTTFLVGSFPRDQLARLWVAIFVVAITVGLGAGVAARTNAPPGKGVRIRAAAPGIVLVATLLALTQTPTPTLLVAAAAAAAIGARWAGTQLASAPLRRGMPLLYVVAIVAGYATVSWFDGIDYNGFQGLLLNVFLALGGILLCFPFGVLLALGRRSTFPAIRVLCAGYIELIRGTPLIVLLLMGATMLGFFLPPDSARPGNVTRALIVFVLFASAYVAEDVRGGLQSVPKGQIEAAKSLGLSPITTMLRVVLPQALRSVLPALVSQFISLTKDTVLVTIIGLTDVLRVARAVTSQSAFVGQGLQAETLMFAAFLLWSLCFAMSRASQRLEARIELGQR